MQSREQVADELSRLQRDNESLQGKHRMHLSLQQQEDFQLPTSVQVCPPVSPPIPPSVPPSAPPSVRPSAPPFIPQKQC